MISSKLARGAQKATATAAKSRSKAVKKAAAEPVVDQFAGLPSVPTISGMRVEDFTLSKFFSLHRPVSIDTTIPPPSTPEAFSSLFDPQQREDPWANGNSAERRPEDVIYTLHTGFDALENNAPSSDEDGLRWEAVHHGNTAHNSEEGVKHLDGIPRIKTIDELVAQFRPFKTPPPPVPFPDHEALSEVQQKRKANTSRSSAPRGRPRKQTYTATITVTESTDAQGQKTYSASSSPIIRLPDAAEEQNRMIREPGTKTRYPFRARMQARQRANATIKMQSASGSAKGMVAIRRAPSPARRGRMGKMLLISVKRQRKLKMKKHKYKKLMKRTRNLRRRLDRN